MRELLGFGGLLLLAACGGTSEPDPTPAEDGGAYERIDPVEGVFVNNGSRPADGAGTWSETRIDGRNGLLFSDASGTAQFAMACDDRGGMVLQRRGVPATGGLSMMTVTFGGEVQRYAVNELATPEPVLQAIAPYNDRLIARMKEVQAPLGIEIGDLPPLALPPSEAVSALARTCATT